MFDRFSNRSRKVMAQARQEAERLGHGSIGTEHVLLGLVHEGAGIAAAVLENLDVDLTRIRREVEKRVTSGTTTVDAGQMPFTPMASKALEFTVEESRRLGHDYLGTEHLLLGLIREEEGIAAQVLRSLEIDLDDARDLVRLTVGQEQIDPIFEFEGSERPGPMPGIRAHLDTALRHLARVQGLLPEDPRPSVPLDAEAEEALGHGADLAYEEGRPAASPLHVLLGLLAQSEGTIHELLGGELGIDVQALREAARRRLETPEEGEAPSA